MKYYYPPKKTKQQKIFFAYVDLEIFLYVLSWPDLVPQLVMLLRNVWSAAQ